MGRVFGPFGLFLGSKIQKGLFLKMALLVILTREHVVMVVGQPYVLRDNPTNSWWVSLFLLLLFFNYYSEEEKLWWQRWSITTRHSLLLIYSLLLLGCVLRKKAFLAFEVIGISL